METQTKTKRMRKPEQDLDPEPLRPPDSGCNRKAQLLELGRQRLLERFSGAQLAKVLRSPKMMLHSWYDLCNTESTYHATCVRQPINMEIQVARKGRYGRVLEGCGFKGE